MKIVYLDTETSGFKPGQICQMTYIIEENNTPVKVFNQFFKVNYVDAGASKVTGLTKEKLDILSDGIVFEDKAQEIWDDLNDSLVIAHNVMFDDRFVRSEMERVGKRVNYRRYCTMNYFTDILKIPGRYGKPKWVNVAEVMKFLNISDDMIMGWACKCFGKLSNGAHDSRFDTMAVYMMILALKKSGRFNAEEMKNIAI